MAREGSRRRALPPPARPHRSRLATASPGPSLAAEELRRAAAGVSVLDLAHVATPSPPLSPPTPTPSLLPRRGPRHCRRCQPSPWTC
uniref:Uncharacterized protein n=1 Tax=Oryza rufipogon TaxID=4529 RepID=A0A0E0PWS4_ORYRU